MIHTDGIHVVSDTSLEELHEWAKMNRIHRAHFHTSRWPHYDLPIRRRREKFADANHTTSRGLLKAMMAGPIFYGPSTLP
jgi:hypothetical protein